MSRLILGILATTSFVGMVSAQPLNGTESTPEIVQQAGQRPFVPPPRDENRKYENLSKELEESNKALEESNKKIKEEMESQKARYQQSLHQSVRGSLAAKTPWVGALSEKEQKDRTLGDTLVGVGVFVLFVCTVSSAGAFIQWLLKKRRASRLKATAAEPGAVPNNGRV